MPSAPVPDSCLCLRHLSALVLQRVFELAILLACLYGQKHVKRKLAKIYQARQAETLTPTPTCILSCSIPGPDGVDRPVVVLQACCSLQLLIEVLVLTFLSKRVPGHTILQQW